MRIVWIVFFVLAGGLAAAWWLGWARSSNWQQATGWAQVLPAERAWLARGQQSYATQSNAPVLNWEGHATLRIDWGGVRLVTDPVVTGRVKVAPRLFPEPLLDTTAAFDVVLISHAHMDHLDNASLAQLAPTRIILPAGSQRFLSEPVRRKHQLIPIHVGDSISVGAVEIVAVEAAHGGWRYPWQRGLFACGYVIRYGGESLYVAGDTAQGSHFKLIAASYAPRYAVLPIGAFSPEWFLRKRHLNPEEAIDAASILGAEYVIPYHFGTFRLSLEPPLEPLPRFARVAYERGQKWIFPVRTGL